MMNQLTEVEAAAKKVRDAQAALDAAQREHADAVADQAPPKHVSAMTDAERKAAAQKRGFTGSAW
jgi:hypothetical protein